ncbi:MAG: hypothetical protein MUC63_00240, partial [Planctomycetes bacterium]|nr:hypothetical protein [Planctomycetota bacterium]
DVVLKIKCGCSPACRLAYDVVFLNEGGKYRECGHITQGCDGRAGKIEYGFREGVFARFAGEECYENATTAVEDGVETLNEEYTYYRVTEEYVFAGDRVVLKRRRRFQISMNELEFLPKP